MPQDTSSIRLIVGLGNPGSEYEATRHNCGFQMLDLLAEKYGGRFAEDRKFSGENARVRIEGEDVWLLKPTTFMNRSGIAVQAMAAYYKITPAEILIVHDELDLLPGTMKLKKGGGNAGHNGLKSITAQLGTPDFWRLRIGIGHPRTFGWAQQVFDFVLAAPSSEHREAIRRMMREALGGIPLLVTGEWQRAGRHFAKFGSLPKPKAEPERTPEGKTEKKNEGVAQ